MEYSHQPTPPQRNIFCLYVFQVIVGQVVKVHCGVPRVAETRHQLEAANHPGLMESTRRAGRRFPPRRCMVDLIL